MVDEQERADILNRMPLSTDMTIVESPHYAAFSILIRRVVVEQQSGKRHVDIPHHIVQALTDTDGVIHVDSFQTKDNVGYNVIVDLALAEATKREVKVKIREIVKQVLGI